MTPNQPYLLRAFYEWIVDNDLTPHIVVNAMLEGVDVPTEHIKDGQIVLNIGPTACGELLIQNDWVSFKARFSGVARELFVPVPAVLAIFARENGAGTVFMDEETQGESASQSDGETEMATPADSTDTAPGAAETQTSADTDPAENKESAQDKPAVLQSVSSKDNDDDPTPTPPRVKGKPSLKVIK